jgi:hypothetical protein
VTSQKPSQEEGRNGGYRRNQSIGDPMIDVVFD